MPEPEKLERDPPETERSETTKSVEGSERVSVRVAVSPTFKEETSEARAMVGLTVSTGRVIELSASAPSRLKLPMEFEKVPDSTDIKASSVLSVPGVKIAV